MSFDSSDPYDAATWWFQSLCCEKCGVVQDYNYQNPHEVAVDSDQGFHDYAQRAKKAGWIVLAKDPIKAEWTILCPSCSPQI
jgi:hypothetical protein